MLAYLSRYTHRIAISNGRLVALGDTHVAFRWRDYAHGGVQKVMHLEAHEFIRRFLQHVLPDGFQRIRHYGFLANGHRKSKLMAIRALLSAAAPPPATAGPSRDKQQADEAAEAPVPCPCCGGIMTIVEDSFPARTGADGQGSIPHEPKHSHRLFPGDHGIATAACAPSLS